MNVLAIGNSFSEDATRYLHAIARADGKILNVANLYIGGCPLERHYRNMLSNERAYELQYNGEKTGFPVSLNEALLNRSWDIITLQQASLQSFKAESYEPYISALAEHIRKCQPKAKIYIHQTWAYENGSDRLLNLAKYESFDAMLSDVKECYKKAYEAIRADGLIPSGEMLGSLLKNGIPTVHRDTFHASRGIGRYALGLIWYRALFGADVSENTFSDFDEEISTEDIKTAKKCANALCKS